MTEFATQQSALVVVKSPEIAAQLAAALPLAPHQWEHIPSLPSASARFVELGLRSVFCLVTTDTMLIVQKNVHKAACPRCVHLGRMSRFSQVEAFAFQQGLAVDENRDRALPEPVIAMTAAICRSRLQAAGNSAPFAVAIDLRTGELTRFTPQPLAVCGCGAVRPAPDMPMKLSRQRKYRSDVSRTTPCSDLKLDVGRFVNPVCGPLGPIMLQIRETPFSVPVIGAFRDPTLPRSKLINWVGLQNTYKAGILTGVLEGLERQAGLSPRGRQTIRASYDDLREHAIHPLAIGLYEDEIYARTPSLRAFDAGAPIDWIRGWSVTRDAAAYVPLEFAYYGHPGMIQGNSSGCAAGCSQEEAALFALLELIERDSFVYHWLRRLAPPRIRTDSIRDRETRIIIARLEAADAKVFLLDGRLDLRIPVVFAVVLRPSAEFGRFSLASGAGLSVNDALRKAVTEVAPSIHGLEERVRKASESHLSKALDDHTLVRELDDHALFFGLPGADRLADFLLEGPEVDVAAIEEEWAQQMPKTAFIDDELRFVVAHLQAAGLPETVLVDQTSPEQAELGFHTMRAIVPGLLPLDFGHDRCRAATMERLFKPLGGAAPGFTPEMINRVPHPYP